LRIALRQHCTLVEPAELQDAPDLAEAAAAIAHRTVKDDISRQHIVAALVGEGQSVGMGLPQAQSEAARRRLVVSEVETRRATVDCLDGEALSEATISPRGTFRT
jgi:hypothetical protein